MTNNLDSNVRQFEDFDEVDIAKIFKILFRNKKLIFLTTTIFVVFGYFIYLFKKPIWEGQFDIVLRNNNSMVNQNPLQSINAGTLNQFIQKGSVFDIKTEVQILKSQSTLRPVFNFVKEEYKKKGNDVSGFTFNSWLNNLDITTKRDTSVLNIKYNDADKDIVIPVLSKISTEYQKYSGRDRNRGLIRGIDYLEKQKSKLTIESRRSIAALQKFALENNLADFDEFLPPDISTGINSNNKNDTDSRNLQIKTSTSRFRQNFNQLYRLESLLVTKSALLKPNAPQIIALKSRIDSLKKSLDRPSSILLKYRDLRREATRTEQLLINIEGQLEVLKLDLARKEEPWELISDVTINGSPVSPKRNKILFFSLIIGLGLSSIYSLIIYKLKDLIDSLESFKKALPYDYIKTFSIKDKDSWENSFLLIKDKFSLDTSKNKLGLLFLNSIESENSDLFINSIKLSKDKNIVSSTSLNSLIQCKNLIIVSEADSISKADLKYIIEDIQLLKVNIIGWLYIV